MGDLLEDRNGALSRLHAMTNPKQQTWDLSENDVDAIRFALREIDRLESRPPPPESSGTDLDALQALCDQATPGPWHHCCADGGGCGGYFVWRDESADRMVDTSARGDGEKGGDPLDRADAAFIAAARTALPPLLDEVRRLRAGPGRKP